MIDKPVGVAYKHAVIELKAVCCGLVWIGSNLCVLAGGVGNYRHAMVTGHLGSVLVLSATECGSIAA